MNKLNLVRWITITTCVFLQYSIPGQGFPPASVNVVSAEIKPLAPFAWASGTVISRNNSQISAEVSGLLILLAEIGDIVTKGDVIAQIDDKSLLIKKQ